MTNENSVCFYEETIVYNVFKLLRKNRGWMTPREIAHEVNEPIGYMYTALANLVSKGAVIRDKDGHSLYRMNPKFDNFVVQHPRKKPGKKREGMKKFAVHVSKDGKFKDVFSLAELEKRIHDQKMKLGEEIWIVRTIEIRPVVLS